MSSKITRAHDFTTDRDGGTKILAASVDAEFETLFDAANQKVQIKSGAPTSPAPADGDTYVEIVGTNPFPVVRVRDGTNGRWRENAPMDADGDTLIQVEESADEDIIRMDVAGAEAFKLDAAGILGLPLQAAAGGYATTNQSINSSSETQIVLTEDFDINADFASNAFTVPVTGIYLVCAQIIWNQAVADAQVAELRVKVDSTVMISQRDSVGGSSTPVVNASRILQLTAAEEVTLFAYHEHGSARTISGASNTNTWLTVCKIA